MSQNNLIKMKSTESTHMYWTRKNKKGEGAERKLELKKYDPILRKHVIFKESKK
ncbi:50S ribosomal protein L33 [Candidatus Wolfebacteria bacterium]|nr:50S ribosomal protein L33 [Candidatus Wolfebacteria bacterium]